SSDAHTPPPLGCGYEHRGVRPRHARRGRLRRHPAPRRHERPRPGGAAVGHRPGAGVTWTRQLAGARSGGSVQPTGQTHPGPPAAWSSSARCRKRLDRGSATAELAAALPVIVLLLLFGLTAVA